MIEEDIDALSARVQSAHMTIATALTDLTDLVARAEAAATRAELAAVNSSVSASTSDTAASVAAAAASMSTEAAAVSVESVETIEETIEDATQEQPEQAEIPIHRERDDGEKGESTEPELPTPEPDRPITIIVKRSGTDTNNRIKYGFRRRIG